MGTLARCLFFYLLGGLTFLPLLLLGLLLHAYLTFPIKELVGNNAIIEPGDDTEGIGAAQKKSGTKRKSRPSHDSDVAAGYFAVCREYVPGGVNGKPPERSSPVGSAPVSVASPSVYQSMYRSLFERKQNNSPLANKGAAKSPKKGGNVFYIVLRHGHLVLFDDEDQIEVRHVISLHHHQVSIYSGDDYTPEGELFIRRNAICLSRKTDDSDINVDAACLKPFFLFSDNCSDKEDFYFALLRNQIRLPGAKDNPPSPLHFEVKDIITLVQRLHSSEEHLQTRWVNAIIGRVFLALYKTPEVESFIRTKITKKISRVKTPAFLSKIVLRHVDMGEAAPVITNPRLKDLTVDGELVVEADVRYSGNFRLEVATTARIELGTRFKPREVNLLLAVVIKRIEGHVLFRIKAPPSNRIWMSFQTMPKVDMTIEPIVSSRQITYTLILRQIENRIKEVIAESLVLPNWDDSPFYESGSKQWRGGMWADLEAEPGQEEATTTTQDIEDLDPLKKGGTTADPDSYDNSALEKAAHDERSESNHDASISDLPPVEKSISMPLIEEQMDKVPLSRRGNKSDASKRASSSSVDIQPRILRKGSFASSPSISTSVTNVDAVKDVPLESGTSSAMAAISALSSGKTPLRSPTASARVGSSIGCNSRSSTVSDLSGEDQGITIQPSMAEPLEGAGAPSSDCKHPNDSSTKSKANTLEQNAQSPTREGSTSSSKSSIGEAKKLSLAAVTSAAANAKKWGWNALQRPKAESTLENTALFHPAVMGRGRPLPPPGTPLPGPEKRTKTAPIPVTKRKPIPRQDPQKDQSASGTQEAKDQARNKLSPPALPKRRIQEGHDGDEHDSVFVVSVPADEPKSCSPSANDIQPWIGDADDEKGADDLEPPQSPKRRQPHRIFVGSPDEDGPILPSWLIAQEAEARKKQTFPQEDMGL